MGDCLTTGYWPLTLQATSSTPRGRFNHPATGELDFPRTRRQGKYTVIEIEPPKSRIHKLCLNTWVYKTRCTQLDDCGCMGREKPIEGWPELWGSPARLANRSKHKLWLGLWGRFSHVLHKTRVNVLNSSLLWPKPCLHSYVVWSRFQSECLIHIQTVIPLRNTIFSLALNIHTMSITYLCNQVQLYQAAYLGYETNVSTKKSQNKRAWIETLERDRWRE